MSTEGVYSDNCRNLNKTNMLQELIPLPSNFVKNENAKWVLFYLGAIKASSETQGQIVGTRKSLNGRKNIWHEEK